MSEHIWRRSFIIWMVNGISILQAGTKMMSGQSAHMCWNVQIQIRLQESGQRKVRWDVRMQMKFSFEAFSLDATVFENKGKHYYVWAEKVGVGKQISNLYIGEMETPYKLKTVQVLLTSPDYDWERVGFWVNEGPAVIHHNGRIYLTYSASETGVAYCMGMLAADEDSDLLDPKSWTKERYPVLRTDESRGIYGPGHNSFTEDEEGNPIMVYHARTEAEIEGNPLYNPNRHAMLMKIRWDEKTGAPIFSYED